MILRGPGAAWQGTYPAADIRVYDELGEVGERIPPYYNYLVIWRGLYTVHGGSIDWTNDGLGIVSFSNELWNGGQYFNSPLLQEQKSNPSSPISGLRSSFFFDDLGGRQVPARSDPDDRAGGAGSDSGTEWSSRAHDRDHRVPGPWFRCDDGDVFGREGRNGEHEGAVAVAGRPR